MGLFSKKQYIYSNVPMYDLLPIGSVIKRKNDNKLYFIENYRGVKRDSEDRNKYIEVDYWCYTYPFGFTLELVGEHEDFQQIGITHDEIEEVIFTGYNTPDRLDILYEVEKLEKTKKSKKT